MQFIFLTEKDEVCLQYDYDSNDIIEMEFHLTHGQVSNIQRRDFKYTSIKYEDEQMEFVSFYFKNCTTVYHIYFS